MPRVTAEQIEHAIEHPSDGQVDLFLDFEWLVPFLNGRPWIQPEGPDEGLFSLQYLFTSADRFNSLNAENEKGKEFQKSPYPLTTSDGWNLIGSMTPQAAIDECKLAPIKGSELFQNILDEGCYCASAQANPGCGSLFAGCVLYWSSSIPDNKNPLHLQHLREQIPDLLEMIECAQGMIDSNSHRIAPRFMRSENANALRYHFPDVLTASALQIAQEKFRRFSDAAHS